MRKITKEDIKTADFRNKSYVRYSPQCGYHLLKVFHFADGRYRYGYKIKWRFVSLDGIDIANIYISTKNWPLMFDTPQKALVDVFTTYGNAEVWEVTDFSAFISNAMKKLKSKKGL